MKTLIFCTGYAKSAEDWDIRYALWINHIESTGLEADKILIIDDGSEVLPSWEGVDVIQEGELPNQESENRGTIYHFENNLGRPSIYVIPGWYRSFMFAAEYAKKYNYEKVIHIESDAAIISDRLQTFINEFKDGWTTFWCPKYQLPETSIQVIAGSALNKYYGLSSNPYSMYSGQPPDPDPSQGDSWIEFDMINKDFKGDRYGEYPNGITPDDADYVCQINPEFNNWWLVNN